MRLEFHQQVAADIWRIMDYYEDVAGPQLADEFYSELRSFFQKQPTLRKLTAFANAISDASISKDFRTISCFASSATRREYWLFGTTAGDRRLGSIDVDHC